MVSEYYNSAGNDEWIELLVINDNTDLRGFTIRDNGASQTSWQDSAIFANIQLWNNLRAGTIIIIWLRSAATFPIDTIKSDGFIQVSAQMNNYLNGPAITIGATGEIIQIRDATGNNIHALGHRNSAGSSFTTGILGTIKLNHSSGINTGDNVSVCPGANLSDYTSGTSDTIYSSKGSNYITQGLPNKRSNDSTANRNYWRSLRQPIDNSPTLNTITANANFTQTNLSWSACTDTNPSDSTTGYIVLRNTINSFTNPSDSIVYSVGSTIGTATVVSNINSSTTLAYDDNFAFTCGTTYYYKIYAFRFSADNNNISNAARGRAYNETGTNVQSIIKSYPLAQTIIPN